MSIDLSLDRIRRLASQLPTYTRPTCHIAGTNGKGSVSCLLSSVLRSSGFSIGRFNSPHLVSIHDCITIDDTPVDVESYKNARRIVEGADHEHNTAATRFELLTLTALWLFEHKKVDVVVLEVGMGGRLDATNVIHDDCVLVSALASVDLDHQAFLGDTVDKIAREKAGIARRGKPFVMGVQKHAEVEAVVREVAEVAGARFTTAKKAAKRAWDVSLDGVEHSIKSLLPLHGEHQFDNLGLSLTIVSELIALSLPLDFQSKISEQAIRQGLRTAVWPGRLSFHRMTLPSNAQIIVLADGAHNPSSSETLAAYISEVLSLSQASSALPTIHISFIIALSDSPPKTPLQTIRPLFPPRAPMQTGVSVKVAALRFTPPDDMPWVKSVAPSRIHDAVNTVMPSAKTWTADDDAIPSENHLLEALEWCTPEDALSGEQHLTVVAGSLYLVADLYRFIGTGGV
ncbi:Mur ligase [Coniophora puteana RWD-64-598 SS2]|uniref:Mur ligase n=1 Tax=Coniophora puteana (strain RWD-64-598) TaxID=741705 RepID=A0A5M3MP20_CONPW|nr:Mur ligase [Coniophora puteana RWD-64-598 SS2]EIW80909.1 Mur ligase [Coniophora puteana RWD-64-598 SS2]